MVKGCRYADVISKGAIQISVSKWRTEYYYTETVRHSQNLRVIMPSTWCSKGDFWVLRSS